MTECSHAFFILHVVPTEIDELYLGHMRRIAAKPIYSDVFFVVAMEQNLSQIEVNRAGNFILEEFGAHRVYLCRSSNKSPGVLTNAPEKEDYAKTMQILLVDQNLRFALDDNIVSLDWKGNQRALYEQLTVFRRRRQEPKDPGFGKVKVTYSGKAKGQPDDCVLSLQIAIVWQQRMRLDERFRAMCKRIGKRI